jgi:hypothetical protein
MLPHALVSFTTFIHAILFTFDQLLIFSFHVLFFLRALVIWILPSGQQDVFAPSCSHDHSTTMQSKECTNETLDQGIGR